MMHSFIGADLLNLKKTKKIFFHEVEIAETL